MIMNFFIKRLPIKDRIVFIHLTGNQLESDLLMIYKELKDEYNCVVITASFTKNSLKSNLCYMFNTFKQLYYVNSSSTVIINNNNYVISEFKRKEVYVLQVWHATGAIKKFGNALERVYKIKNYNTVLCSSEYFIEPYKEAFACDDIQITGLPRVDELYHKFDDTTFYERYPSLKGKKIVLYAPTFRGDVYKGFSNLPVDFKSISKYLGDDYCIIGRYHPLVESNDEILCINDFSLYDLFKVSHCLVSDYSSIIFDYALLNKPIVLYAPDLASYKEDIGLFVQYETMLEQVCTTEIELSSAIQSSSVTKVSEFKQTFFKYDDGHNLKRVIDLIKKQCN